MAQVHLFLQPVGYEVLVVASGALLEELRSLVLVEPTRFVLVLHFHEFHLLVQLIVTKHFRLRFYSLFD